MQQWAAELWKCIHVIDVATAYMQAITDVRTYVCTHTRERTRKTSRLHRLTHQAYNDEVVVVVAYEDEWQG